MKYNWVRELGFQNKFLICWAASISFLDLWTVRNINANDCPSAIELIRMTWANKWHESLVINQKQAITNHTQRVCDVHIVWNVLRKSLCGSGTWLYVCDHDIKAHGMTKQNLIPWPNKYIVLHFVGSMNNTNGTMLYKMINENEYNNHDVYELLTQT